MPATQYNVTTIGELLALPEDGLRHELLRGVHAVTPAPRRVHQRIHMSLIRQLDRAMVEVSGVEFLSSPADIRLGPDTLVQPDLFVLSAVPGTGSEDWDDAEGWEDAGIPLVAIEILSPSTASRDRGVKRRIYQQAGVAEYWIVDIDARLIERWKPEDDRPEICDTELRCEIAGTPVVLAIADIFRKP